MTEPLPPGWAWSTVGEMSNVILGQSPPGSSYNEVGHGFPFFQGKAEFRDLYPEVRKWTTQPKKNATAGSILVSVRAPVGPTNIAPFDCSIGRGLAALHPIGGMETSYLLWAMRHTEAQLAQQGTGSTFDAITGTQLKSHPLPTAPLAEQKRIITAIEEHFSRIDAAESAAQTALARLDTLRRAILTAAFSGHLVKPLNPRRTPDGLPEDWKLHTLDEIMHGSLFSDGDWVESKDQDPSGSVRLIQLADIGEGVFRDRSNRWLNEPTAEKLGCTYLHKDDILIARMPDPIGRTCLMPYLESLSVTAVDVCILRPNPNSLFAPWLMWRINSPSFRIKVEALQSGTTRKRISRKNLSTIPIALPPLEDQKQIVAVIEERFSRINAAKASLERCLQRCGILRRAVLATAFSGRLVEQDPSDEPASVLLERIAAEQPKRRTQRRSA